MSFALHIEIPPEVVDSLKHTDYKLCIAQVVKGQCRIICNGNKEYLHKNKFIINDQFSLTTTNVQRSKSTKSIKAVRALTRSLSAFASANSPNSSSLTKTGEYKMIAFGVKGWFDRLGSYTPVFVSEFLCTTPGVIVLDPHKSFMIWFDREHCDDNTPCARPEARYHGSQKNAIVVDFSDGEMVQTVCYSARPGQAGNGTWTRGPSGPRYY